MHTATLQTAHATPPKRSAGSRIPPLWGADPFGVVLSARTNGGCDALRAWRRHANRGERHGESVCVLGPSHLQYVMAFEKVCKVPGIPEV